MSIEEGGRGRSGGEPPAMQDIRRALRRDWWLKVSAAALLTAAGLLVPLWLWQRSVLLGVLGLGLGITGLRLLFQVVREARRGGYRLLRLLEEHPRQIVWVYGLVTQRLPYGFRINQNGILYFKLADGDEITLSLPPERIKWVSRYLNDRLPHATFGYTTEREQWYTASPYLLLKEGNPSNGDRASQA